MKKWLSELFSARWERLARPLASPEFDFDGLSKELAAGLSRREALRRLGLGLSGALVGSLGLGIGPARAAGGSDCAHWCAGIYPPGSQRGDCVSAAALGQGLCYECGPAAPADSHLELCGTATGAPFCCQTGAANCCGGSTCVNLKSDINNCGVCNNICPQRDNAAPICNQGVPGYRCSAGYGDCDTSADNGCETNLLTDLGHCGACNHPCPVPANATPTCVQGQCGFICLANFADCNGDPSDGCEIHLLTDANNCGACGHACASGEACVNGKCTCGNLGSDCPGGKACCSGMCEDLAGDVNNCGACGNSCPAPANGQAVCQQGVCSSTCQAPYANCTGNPADGCSTNLATDAQHCQACGHACEPGQQCAGGVCVSPESEELLGNGCPGLFPDACGDFCVDTQTDSDNCGTCGHVCPVGTHCRGGQCVCVDNSGGLPKQYCNGACVDVSSDILNCGGCGVTCIPGVCCSGQCVTPATDTNNCGACGNVCPQGASCVLGTCYCPALQPVVCNGVCTDPATDTNNCGLCGSVCPPGAACVLGLCVCPPTAITNCNGVCTNTVSDNNNCGSCGNVCTGGHVCELGVCVCPLGGVECNGVCCSNGQVCLGGTCSCVAGEDFCGGHCIDVLSDPNHCGSCGHVCGENQNCAFGSCICQIGCVDINGNTWCCPTGKVCGISSGTCCC